MATSLKNWRDKAIDRLTEKANEAEKRRDNTEAAIVAIVGELNQLSFYQLRTLFAKWEEADSAIFDIDKRINEI
jgi:hypothetical protein